MPLRKLTSSEVIISENGQCTAVTRNNPKGLFRSMMPEVSEMEVSGSLELTHSSVNLVGLGGIYFT